ncbi:MAG TPA: DNA-binding protein [Candidatus Dormibacteraeota bacterium]|nr:DNA-binding protein [Candidatus Dormibacteraeota bacterium]
MSEDSELEKLKRERLAEMQKRMTAKQQTEAAPTRLEPRQILERVFVGRAWEVYHAARAQYPGIADQIFQELAELVQSGKLRTKITGEQLFGLLRQIGLDVRLDTKIQVLEHGELRPIADKFR